ncbi:UNVERIFIED_CONTAM: hypothetical protein FKN15_069796 [Acipenser sinensis]
MGPSDFARGPSGLPNGPWHLPSTHTGPSYPALGPSGSPNGPLLLPSIPSTHTGPRDPVRGKSGSRNGPWHLPSMRTGPSDFAWGSSGPPNGHAHGPQRLRVGFQRPAKRARARAPATSRGVPAARQTGTRTGPSDFAWGSSGPPNGHAHGPQRLRVGFQRPAKRARARAPATSRGVPAARQTGTRTGPSDFAWGSSGPPNGHAHGPQRLRVGFQRPAKRARARAPATSRGVPAARQTGTRTGPSDFAWGSSGPPNGHAHGPQRLRVGFQRPAKRARARAPATSRGVPAARQTGTRTGPSDFAWGSSGPPNGHAHGPQRLRVGFQRPAKRARARAPATSRGVPAARQTGTRTGPSDFAWGSSGPPNGHAHGPQRLRVGFQRPAKRARARAPATSRGVPAARQTGTRTGPSDFAWGSSGPPNGHAHGPQRLRVGFQRPAKRARARAPATSRGVPAARQTGTRTGPSDFAWGSSGPPNGHAHGPQRLRVGFQRPAKRARARAPATSRGVPAARQTGTRTGPSDFAWGSSGPPNGHAHGPQRLRVGFQRPAKRARARAPATSRGVPAARQTGTRTGPSDFAWGSSGPPNGHAHGPQRLRVGFQRPAKRARARAPATSRGVPAARQTVPDTSLAIARAPTTSRRVPEARQMVPGPSPAQALGPSDIARHPNGSQTVPGTSPAHARAPATLRGVKAAYQTVPDTSPAIAEPKRPRAGSQRLAKWSLEHSQDAHGAQRPCTGQERFAKWFLAPPQHTHGPP